MRASSFLLVIAAVVLVLSFEQYEAIRILGMREREWKINGEYLLLPSLQTKPPSPNGCTFVPGGGGNSCQSTINQMHFSGRVVVAPPPPPVTSDGYQEQKVQFDPAT
ncbi:hypothetical protein ABFS82_04G038600 [Erythranthe guttata]